MRTKFWLENLKVGDRLEDIGKNGCGLGVWIGFIRLRVETGGGLLALMIEAVSTSETSVNLYETARRDGPEDS
jgi:hypothetical protein